MSVTMRHREMLIQLAHDCCKYSEYAISTFERGAEMSLALQHLNYAFQCSRQFQYCFMESYDRLDSQHADEFYRQFYHLNEALMKTFELGTGVGQPKAELEMLKNILDDLVSDH